MNAKRDLQAIYNAIDNAHYAVVPQSALLQLVRVVGELRKRVEELERAARVSKARSSS